MASDVRSERIHGPLRQFIAENNMSELNALDRSEIIRIVRHELRTNARDEWLGAAAAAAHLKMSRHHFLRLCRNGQGPVGYSP